VEAAALERAAAQQGAQPFVELLHGGPADVAAPRAFTGVHALRRGRNFSDRSATETFELEPFHPRHASAELRTAGNPSIEGVARAQSVEYFGWTYSPRIAAMALLAAIAASPIPIVISVIFPG
jgi:hypothetical protein